MLRRTSILVFSIAVITQATSSKAQRTTALPCPCQSQKIWAIVSADDSVFLTRDTISPPFKSPSRALTYSFLGTLAPLPTLILALPGIIVGPSLGYFYGGMPGRAWIGIGLRTAGLGGMISSFAICGWDCGPGDSGSDIGLAVLLAGGGLTVVSAIVDIASVKGDIRERNEKLAAGSSLTAGPMFFPMTKTMGFGLSLSFD